MRILGIDLGTTNTAASIEGYVISLAGKGGSLLPSVVSFLPNGRTLVGLAAARRRALDPVNTIFSSKRVIGRRWTSTGTQDFRGRYPFDLIESGKDGTAFRTRAGSFTPTEVASMLLSAVFDQVKDRAWSLEGRAVTVPAAFGPGQRNATLEAARMAGLDDVFLVDEPMATATAYRGQPGPEPGRVAIYDLGGGTFNFALVDCTGREPRVLAHASDLFLGGDDIDHAIAGWAINEVLERYNWDLRNYAEVHARLVTQCEQAKVRLSGEARTFIDLTRVDPDCPGARDGIELGRSKLDELCEAFVRRTFITCDAVLAQAGLVPRHLDAVLLAGGSTHIPGVRRGVEDYFGQSGRQDLEPTEVVALGASLIAA